MWSRSSCNQASKEVEHDANDDTDTQVARHLIRHQSSMQVETVVRARLGMKQQECSLHLYGGLLHVVLYPITLTLYLTMYALRILPLATFSLDYTLLKESAPGLGGRIAGSFFSLNCFGFVLFEMCFHWALILSNFILLLALQLIFMVPLDIVLLLCRPVLSVRQCHQFAHWTRPSTLLFADASFLGGSRWASIAHNLLGAMPSTYALPCDMIMLWPWQPTRPDTSCKAGLVPCIHLRQRCGFSAGMKNALILVSHFGCHDESLCHCLTPVFLEVVAARDNLVKSCVAAEIVDKALAAEVHVSSLLAWAVVLKDEVLLKTWLQDSQATVTVTVTSISGNVLFGPTALRSLYTIFMLARDFLGQRSEDRCKFLLEGSDREISGDERLIQFVPGDVKLTFVRLAPVVHAPLEVDPPSKTSPKTSPRPASLSPTKWADRRAPERHGSAGGRGKSCSPRPAPEYRGGAQRLPARPLALSSVLPAEG